MFDSTLNPVDGLVLPALEATYMVTSVEDSDPCQKSEETISSARARKPSSLQIPKSPKHNSKWRAGRILSWIVPPLLGLFILYGWQFGSSNIGEFGSHAS